MTRKFTCDFCSSFFGGGFLTEQECQDHEAKCDGNPDNKTCATCKHWHEDWDTRATHKDWKPVGGPWESEDDIPDPVGCHQYHDQQYRGHCEKWEFGK